MSGLANEGWGANRGNWANPPPSEPAPGCQVALQVTYGVRGATGLTWGWRGGGAELRASSLASGPCDWPRLAMVAWGSLSLRDPGATLHSF